MSEQRMLSADVYDTLELSALAFGGIGAWVRHDGDLPFCVMGHAVFVEGGDVDAWYGGNLSYLLFQTTIDGSSNDSAVASINFRKGKRGKAKADRVSWEEYTRELNIVRGQ